MRAFNASITGARSVEDTAQQRGLPGATQQGIAVLLQTKVNRLPPLVRLVLVETPGIDTTMLRADKTKILAQHLEQSSRAVCSDLSFLAVDC